MTHIVSLAAKEKKMGGKRGGEKNKKSILHQLKGGKHHA